jgi:hypothetical protein
LGFWPSLLLASLVTALAYGAWVLIARRLGLDL